jgi:hypothetical protein
MGAISRLHAEVTRQLRERLRRCGGSVAAHFRRGAPLRPGFEVKPKACGFRAGVDVLRLNQLDDELEMEDFRHELAAARRQQ